MALDYFETFAVSCLPVLFLWCCFGLQSPVTNEPIQLTANQWFRHIYFSLISLQSEGLGKMALGIVKYFYDRPSQPIGVIWFVVSLSRSVVVDPWLISLLVFLCDIVCAMYAASCYWFFAICWPNFIFCA